MDFDDDMDLGQSSQIPSGFLNSLESERADDEDAHGGSQIVEKDWEAWKDVTGRTYRGVRRKQTMLEYFIDSAKSAAKHVVSCTSPSCTTARRPATLCDVAMFLLTLTLDAKRFKDGPYEAEADAVLKWWSIQLPSVVASDPRYILFAATYNIILVQAAVYRDTTFAPTFGGEAESV